MILHLAGGFSCYHFLMFLWLQLKILDVIRLSLEIYIFEFVSVALA